MRYDYRSTDATAPSGRNISTIVLGKQEFKRLAGKKEYIAPCCRRPIAARVVSFQSLSVRQTPNACVRRNANLEKHV